MFHGGIVDSFVFFEHVDIDDEGKDDTFGIVEDGLVKGYVLFLYPSDHSFETIYFGILCKDVRILLFHWMGDFESEIK